MRHGAEFRRCLLEADVVGIQRLWRHVAPHLPQPKNTDETLFSIHSARVQMATIPAKLKDYSKAWLAERETRKRGLGVGISVSAPEHRREQGLIIRTAMSEAVTDAIKAGVDLETEPDEIRRRMMRARERA